MKTGKVPAILGIFSAIMAVLSITTSSTIFRVLFGISGIAGLLLQTIYIEKKQVNRNLLILLCLWLLRYLF